MMCGPASPSSSRSAPAPGRTAQLGFWNTLARVLAIFKHPCMGHQSASSRCQSSSSDAGATMMCGPASAVQQPQRACPRARAEQGF